MLEVKELKNKSPTDAYHYFKSFLGEPDFVSQFPDDSIEYFEYDKTAAVQVVKQKNNWFVTGDIEVAKSLIPSL